MTSSLHKMSTSDLFGKLTLIIDILDNMFMFLRKKNYIYKTKYNGITNTKYKIRMKKHQMLKK